MAARKFFFKTRKQRSGANHISYGSKFYNEYPFLNGIIGIATRAHLVGLFVGFARNRASKMPTVVFYALILIHGGENNVERVNFLIGYEFELQIFAS